MAVPYDQDKWGLVARLLQCLPMVSIDLDDDSDGLPRATLYPSEAAPDETASDRLALWRRRVEAMELLALVWIVDPDAWKLLLLDKTPGSIHGHTSENGVMPAYTVFFPATDSQELTQTLGALFSPIREDEHSEDFQLAKASILAQEDRQSVLAACEKLQPSVELVPSRESTDARSAIVHFFETMRGSPLRFKLAGVNYFDPNTISRESVDAIHDQIQQGLPLGRTLMGLLRVESFLTRHVANQLFTDMLGAFGASSLDIRHVNRRRETMEAFFSKLTDPTSETPVNATGHVGVRALRLASFQFGESVAERRSELLWFFYGLFSQDARHSIHHLQHSVYGRRANVDDTRWLSELLRVRGDPRPELFIADVFEEYVDQEGPVHGQWLTVPSGYPIRVQHGDDWRANALVFEDHETRFRVLRDDPTWNFVDILVPGYGRCWVERSEAVAIEMQPLTKWTFSGHSIRSLDLGLFYVNEGEINNLCELLALVCQPVEILRLTQWISREEIVPTGLSVAVLTSIVRSCPQLGKLSLGNVPVASAEVLIDLYKHNTCSITTLDLPHGAFVDRTSVYFFLDALADPMLQISRTLEVLHLDLTGYTPDGQEDDETLVIAALNMLQTNPFLKNVEIRVVRDHFSSFGSQFRALRETLIPRQKAPLLLRSKCALLSVVGETTMPLEQGVLTSVFEFAAECETREVTITTSSTFTFP